MQLGRSLFFVVFLSLVFMKRMDAQKTNNVWVFGYHAGLDFGTDPPTYLDSTQSYVELPPNYISAIADAQGKLLFYTNGLGIWNRFNKPVPQMRFPWPWSGNAMPLICPYPGNDSLYYLFAVSDDDFKNQLQYLTINAKGRNGLVDIIYQPSSPQNQATVIAPNASMLLAGTTHCNGKDFWIVSHSPGRLNSFLVTSTGVSSTPVSSQLSTSIVPAELLVGGYGNIKFSANGEKMILPLIGEHKVVVFDFDNQTGLFSNPIKLSLPKNHVLEDVEISADGSKLYVGSIEHTMIDIGVPGASLHHVFQMDLDAGTASAIEQTVFYLTIPDRESCSPKRCNFVYRTLQLAPDGRIYVSMRSAWPEDIQLDKTLSVIDAPDKKGAYAFYKKNSVNVNRKYKYINFNYIRSTSFTLKENGIRVQKKSCADKPVSFSLLFNKVDSVKWDFGDPSSGTQNYAASFTPEHQYPKPGNYTVKAIIYSHCIADTAVATVNVEPTRSVQIPATIKDTFACVGSSFSLDAFVANATTYTWDNGLIYSKRTFDTPGHYSVTVSNECSVERKEFTLSFKECDCQVFVPNAFTPNNDGKNDDFKPTVQCVAKNYHFKVFNRYGEVVFESSEISRGWNGKIKNGMAGTGVYLWTVQYQNPNNKKLFSEQGTVVLIR